MNTLVKSTLGALALAATAASSQALTFNLVHSATMDARAVAGFQAAANNWSKYFNDDATVTINIGFEALGTGILGSTSSTYWSAGYSTIESALAADATSALDAQAVNTLSKRNSNSIYINRYANNPNGAGSLTPWVDNDGSANNNTVLLTQANLRALGYNDFVNAYATKADATIKFSTKFNFDFDGTDGILANAFDFVGIATHEIGHALGFVSRADYTDITAISYYNTDDYGFATTLDLFRYSADSFANNSIDLTADTRAKYFSVDGGLTSLAPFATGVTYGDGRQASHWKDNLGIGILDPTAGYGEKLAISQIDIMGMDAIGWNVTPVPEASTYGLMGGAALAGLVGFRRIRRRK